MGAAARRRSGLRGHERALVAQRAAVAVGVEEVADGAPGLAARAIHILTARSASGVRPRTSAGSLGSLVLRAAHPSGFPRFEWRPLKRRLDGATVCGVDLWRCVSDVAFRLVALRSGQSAEVVEDLRLAGCFVLAYAGRRAFEARGQCGPDHCVQLACADPRLDSRNGGRGWLRPPSHVIIDPAPYAFPRCKLRARVRFAVSVHQRPEHAYGTAIRHYHQRDAPIVGLTGELDRDKRTIVEPVSSDGQRARVPDERSPAQACNVRQRSLPSLLPRCGF